MSLPRLVIALLSALLALPAAASAAPAPGDYVGQFGKTAFGVAVDSGGVIAYACDGRKLGTWFQGRSFKGSAVALRKGSQRLRLTVRGRTLRARFGKQTATLRRATGKAGLYRSESVTGGQRNLGGWVVLPSGKQVGTLLSGSTLLTAPTLSTTTLTAGSLVVAPVLAPADPLPVVLDLDGDGLGIDGRVVTPLLGGSSRTALWTTRGDDDAFVAFDSAALKAKGYTLSVTGRVLARGGVKVTRNGVTTTAVDGFHMLRLLDGNRDGLLSPVDPAFEAAVAFADLDGDGNFGDTPGINGSDMVQQMAAMNLEFMALQAAVQQESRKFAYLSNASKARHEIALSAIRSIAG